MSLIKMLCYIFKSKRNLQPTIGNMFQPFPVIILHFPSVERILTYQGNGIIRITNNGTATHLSSTFIYYLVFTFHYK